MPRKSMASQIALQAQVPLEQAAQGKPGRRNAGVLTSSQKIAKQDLENLLKEDPDLIFPVVYAIRSGQITKTKKDVPKNIGDEIDEEPYFNERYRQHGRVPNYWLASWLMQVAPGVLTSELLIKLQKNDPDVLKKLRHFATGVAGSCRLFKPLLLKVMLARFYTALHNALGRRLSADWLRWALSADGDRIEFDRAGIYMWVRPGVLKHCSGFEVGCLEHKSKPFLSDRGGALTRWGKEVADMRAPTGVRVGSQ